MDPKRFLAPLDAEREAIRQLSEYGSEAELGAAVQRVGAAVDRVLRLLLREERAAPDAARLSAFSADLPTRDVVGALRGADTITMELAAGVVQLEDAAARARTGTIAASDADVAQDVVRRLMDVAVGAGGADLPADSVPEEQPGPRRRRRSGRTLMLAAVLIAAGGSFAWLALRESGPTGQAGVEAFAAGRLAEAEEIFRFRATGGAGTVSDWLYLGRIFRRTDRMEEAAAALRTAVDLDPEDPDVRRELGWLFMDLGRPSAAIEQFELAVETAPEESLNWIGLIRALQATGDPSAEEWLLRAPQDVRDRLTSERAGSDRR